MNGGTTVPQDLVFVYLQATRGYISLPASRIPNTELYEYVLIQPASGALIIVQVRTSKDEPIDIAELARAAANQNASAIAYSTSRNYIGIETQDALSFDAV